MKHKTFIYLLLLVNINIFAQLPGSGRTLEFKASEGDYAQSGISNALSTNGSYTIEGWYLWGNDGYTTSGFLFEIGDASNAYKYMWNNRTGLFGQANGIVCGFRAADGSYNDFVFNYIPPQASWVHLAQTWNSITQTISFYANGILIGSQVSTKTPGSFSDPRIQFCKQIANLGSPTFDGRIDEFRMYNLALDVTTYIRPYMCRKIKTTDFIYSNLICYYKFDDAPLSNAITDYSSNAINGTFSGLNAPTSQVSGAPIGDLSSWNYGGPTAGVILTNPIRGDKLTATLNAGNAIGLQVYCVTDAPNSITGQTALAGNNGYFGIFPINGDAEVAYQTIYDYDGISYAGIAQSKLITYKRNFNNSNIWSKMATAIDSIGKTITGFTRQERSEIMVAAYTSPNSKKPGSGNAIQSSAGGITINNIPFSSKPTKAITVTAWVNITANVNFGGIVANAYENGLDEAGFHLHTNAGTNNVEFGVATTNNTFGDFMPTAPVPLNKWTHIAGTYDGTAVRLYINGRLIASRAATGDIDWITSNPTKYSIGNYTYNNVNSFFNGKIDEVSVWSKALTEGEIRDRMCRKITNSDPLNPYMSSYYNFDENLNGTIAYDGTIYENNGTYTGTVATQVSQAPIGNFSKHDYVNATKVVSLPNPNSVNEIFDVGSSSGNPDGLQVYLVNEKPNSEIGISGVGQNDRYFGVHQIGGTSPQYTAIYSYDGNPFVNASNEYSLALFKRTDNSVTTWTNASGVLDNTFNTIGVLGLSTEYMLGNTLLVLPLNEIKLSGIVGFNNDKLQWNTIGEINIASFKIQHSIDGINFVTLGSTNTKGNGDNIYYFDAPQTSVNNFYRILATDIVGVKQYSNILKLQTAKIAKITVSPNPASNYIILNGILPQSNYVIKNCVAQVVKTGITNSNESIDITKFSKGFYTIIINNTSNKFIVQ
ncbi:MAG: LamG domain-containing protein [Ferruginibacter sp.]|nr:LamG domain-containing protein [Ferruginibacter sp.]